MKDQEDNKKTEKKKLSMAALKARKVREAEKLSGKGVKPHGMVVATLLHRLFIERIAFTFGLCCVLFLAGWQMSQNISLSEQLEKRSIYLVPSVLTKLHRLDPTKIDSSTVYDYAEHIIQKLGNVNYEDADVRYHELAQHMHPELKARFKREMRPIVKYWKQMKVDQHFNFEKPTDFTRKLELHEGSKKSVFHVEVWGRTKKYIEGRITAPYREKISLAFVTKHFSADDTWAFRLIDIKRQTEQQIQDERIKLSTRKEEES